MVLSSIFQASIVWLNARGYCNVFQVRWSIKRIWPQIVLKPSSKIIAWFVFASERVNNCRHRIRIPRGACWSGASDQDAGPALAPCRRAMHYIIVAKTYRQFCSFNFRNLPWCSSICALARFVRVALFSSIFLLRLRRRSCPCALRPSASRRWSHPSTTTHAYNFNPYFNECRIFFNYSII